MAFIHLAVSNRSLLKTASLSTTRSIALMENWPSGSFSVSSITKAVFLDEPKGTMTLRPKRTSSSYFSGTEYVNSPSKGTASTTFTHFTFLDSP